MSQCFLTFTPRDPAPQVLSRHVLDSPPLTLFTHYLFSLSLFSLSLNAPLAGTLIGKLLSSASTVRAGHEVGRLDDPDDARLPFRPCCLPSLLLRIKTDCDMDTAELDTNVLLIVSFLEPQAVCSSSS